MSVYSNFKIHVGLYVFVTLYCKYIIHDVQLITMVIRADVCMCRSKCATNMLSDTETVGIEQWSLDNVK